MANAAREPRARNYTLYGNTNLIAAGIRETAVTDTHIDISIVVPCYNEQESLPIFFEELARTTRAMAEREHMRFEVVLVDDGSHDATLEVMREQAERRGGDFEVRWLSFSRNFGKEAALLAGLAHARGALVATMDADLQDPPSLLPEMYRIICQEGYDNVATRRTTREGEPPIRSAFARLFYRIINHISKTEIVDGARDFRLMKRAMVDAILALPEYNRFSKGIYGWVGFKTKWLPYVNVNRAAGETKWNFFSLLLYSIDGIVAFSTVPLSLASIAGALLCLVAFAALIFIIVRALLFGDPVDGWPSLASIIIFIGGIQLLCLGIMGQYLAKTYLETKRRPAYIVRESNCGAATIPGQDAECAGPARSAPAETLATVPGQRTVSAPMSDTAAPGHPAATPAARAANATEPAAHPAPRAQAGQTPAHASSPEDADAHA